METSKKKKRLKNYEEIDSCIFTVSIGTVIILICIATLKLAF